MTYNLLTVDRPHLDDLAAALAMVLGVPLGEVDVAADDGGPRERNWDALVLCTHAELSGDLSLALDIYARDEVPSQPTERALATGLAAELETAILFPAEEAPPSACWVATPEGVVTRGRLYESYEEPPWYYVDAVESPVPQLPRTPVIESPRSSRNSGSPRR
ncbi:hypothetical protein [Streptomyces sp. NPDC001070]